MNQKKLSEALGGVVEDSVNKVGVDLNTASASLAGVYFRYQQDHGKEYRGLPQKKTADLTDRRQLLKVPKLGPKAYEQCAGFMRISGWQKSAGCIPVCIRRAYEAAERTV